MNGKKQKRMRELKRHKNERKQQFYVCVFFLSSLFFPSSEVLPV